MTTAAELRARAQHIRQLAQYAEGQAYREEMALAQQLENQANWLDDEPRPVTGEDDGH